MAIGKTRRQRIMIAGALAAALAVLALLVLSSIGTGSTAPTRGLAATGKAAARHHAVFVEAKIYRHGLRTKVRARPAVHHAKAGHRAHHRGKHGAHPARSQVAGDSGTVK